MALDQETDLEDLDDEDVLDALDDDDDADARALVAAGTVVLSPRDQTIVRRAADRRLAVIRDLVPDDAVYQIAVTLLRGTGTDASRLRYAQDLRIFLTWVADQGKGPQELTRDDVIEYMDAIKVYKVSSQRRLVTVVRLLYRELEVRGMLPAANPAVMLPKIKGSSDDRPAAFSEEQARNLLVSIQEQFDDEDPAKRYTARRDYAIVFLALTIGLRASEIVGIRVGDIRRERGIYSVIQVRGKGRKERIVKITPYLVEVIEEYKAAMAELGVTFGPDDPLFIRIGWDAKPDGAQPMGTRNLRHLVTKWANRAGLGGPGKAVHQLRRTAITMAIENGATIEQASDMAGHADIRTTRDGYVRPHDRLRNAAVDRIPDLRAPRD